MLSERREQIYRDVAFDIAMEQEIARGERCEKCEKEIPDELQQGFGRSECWECRGDYSWEFHVVVNDLGNLESQRVLTFKDEQEAIDFCDKFNSLMSRNAHKIEATYDAIMVNPIGDVVYR